MSVEHVRPLSIDETLLAIREAVARVGAKRAVIDSLSGLDVQIGGLLERVICVIKVRGSARNSGLFTGAPRIEGK